MERNTKVWKMQSLPSSNMVDRFLFNLNRNARFLSRLADIHLSPKIQGILMMKGTWTLDWQKGKTQKDSKSTLMDPVMWQYKWGFWMVKPASKAT